MIYLRLPIFRNRFLRELNVTTAALIVAENRSDLSLRDLGALMDPPLSRSGVNHRLQRIIQFAAALDEA